MFVAEVLTEFAFNVKDVNTAKNKSLILQNRIKELIIADIQAGNKAWSGVELSCICSDIDYFIDGYSASRIVPPPYVES